MDQAMRQTIYQNRLEYEAEQTRIVMSGRKQKTLSKFQQQRRDLRATKVGGARNGTRGRQLVGPFNDWGTVRKQILGRGCARERGRPLCECKLMRGAGGMERHRLALLWQRRDQPIPRDKNCNVQAEYMRKAKERNQKQKGDSPGVFVNQRYKDADFPVGYILKVMEGMEQQHITDMENSILTATGTPVERYWASSGSSTSHQTKMVPLLKTVFPSGLAPLAQKINRLEAQEERQRLRMQGKLSNAWTDVHPGAEGEPSAPSQPAGALPPGPSDKHSPPPALIPSLAVCPPSTLRLFEGDSRGFQPSSPFQLCSLGPYPAMPQTV